jgi:hypothetical protein
MPWPDELRRKGFEVSFEQADGLASGYVARSGMRVFVNEQRGPDPRHNRSPIAGQRLLMMHTAKATDVRIVESEAAFLEEVVAVLESLGAARLNPSG